MRITPQRDYFDDLVDRRRLFLVHKGLDQEDLLKAVLDDYHNGAMASAAVCSLGMGLTPTAIDVALSLSARRVIVVCPVAVHSYWQQVIFSTVKDENMVINHISEVRTHGLPKGDRFLIVSPELLRRVTRPMVQDVDLFIVQADRYSWVWGHVRRLKPIKTRLLALL